MSVRSALKQFFLTGLKPTQAQFWDLIDSTVHLSDDKANITTDITSAVDNKYVTPAGAKAAALYYSPVKTINGVAPSGGNATFRTVNGTSVVGTGNIAITPGQTLTWVMLFEPFPLQNGSGLQNVFPQGLDSINPGTDKTVMVEGKYIIETGDNDHATLIGWDIYDIIPLSFDYTVSSFTADGLNTYGASIEKIQISGLDTVEVVQSNKKVLTIIEFAGILRFEKSGKIIPQLAFSSAPGGNCKLLKGSFIQFTEYGKIDVTHYGNVS